MKTQIESMSNEHLPAVLALMRNFARFESLDHFFKVTEERLRRAMFEDGAFVEGLVAFADRRIAGYAIFYPYFSSFRGQRGYYLEDLYIDKEFRRHGIGEQMLREIARLALERGFERIDFGVLEWNRSAIDFYERLGAVGDPAERHYKFTDEAFRRLAGR